MKSSRRAILGAVGVAGVIAAVSILVWGVLGGAKDAEAVAVATNPLFEARYELGRDDSGRATLAVSETLEMTFGGQNHGITRVIPNRLKVGDGRSWALDVSVARGCGGWSTCKTEVNNDAAVIKAGDANRYLSGVQTFKFNWMAVDVVMPNEILTDKTQDGDEFHWMVNGDAWEENFGVVKATVRVPENLASELDGRVACWNNETEECEYSVRELEGGGKEFVFAGKTATKAGKSLVFDIGFKPETFAFPAKFYKTEAEAQRGEPVSPWVWVGMGLLVAAPFVIYGAWRFYVWRSNRKVIYAEPVVPQFVAPKFVDTATCEVFWQDKNLLAPILLKLAVDGYVQIAAKGKKPDTVIYMKEADDGLVDEGCRKVLNALFGSKKVGDEVSLDGLKSNRSFGVILDVMQKDVRSEISGGKLVKGRMSSRSGSAGSWVMFSLIGLFIFIEVMSEVTGLIINGVSVDVVVGMIALVAVVAVFVGIVRMATRKGGRKAKNKRLTKEGGDLMRYLMGLREFMTVAEADRIRMLQGAKTAERVETSRGALIKLYERLLPFATIFGIEKEWGKILEVYYVEEQMQPSFWSGYFVGRNFGYMLGSMSAQAASLSGMEARRVATERLAKSSSWSSGGSSSSGFSSGGGGGSFGGGGGGGGRW